MTGRRGPAPGARRGGAAAGRGRPAVSRLLLVAALAAAPAGARAQSTLAGERGTLLVPGGETVPAGHFTASLALDGTAPRGGVQASPFGLTVGLASALDASVSLLSPPPSDPTARGAAQDLQLSVRWRLLYEGEARPAVAIGLAADHLSRGGDLSPSASLHRDWGPLLVAGQLGWRFTSGRSAADPGGAFYGAAAALGVTPSWTVMLQAIGAAGTGQPGLALLPGVAWSLLGTDPFAARRAALRAEGARARAEAEAEAGGPLPGGPAAGARPEGGGPGPAGWSTAALTARSASLSQPGRVTFFVTGGPSLVGGGGLRVLAGIQISSFDELLQDSDGDGIPDRFDRCPYQPEDWDGYEDEDGCPDGGAEILKKLAAERALQGAAAHPRFTTDTPRFRLAIPPAEVPSP